MKRQRSNSVYLVFSRNEGVSDDFAAYPNRMESFFTREETDAHVQARLVEFNQEIRESHYCESFPCPINATPEEMNELEDMLEDAREDLLICEGPYYMAQGTAIKACMQIPEHAEVVDTWGSLEDPYGTWIQVLKIEQKE